MADSASANLQRPSHLTATSVPFNQPSFPQQLQDGLGLNKKYNSNTFLDNHPTEGVKALKAMPFFSKAQT